MIINLVGVEESTGGVEAEQVMHVALLRRCRLLVKGFEIDFVRASTLEHAA
jgi:hypothetical protein